MKSEKSTSHRQKKSRKIVRKPEDFLKITMSACFRRRSKSTLSRSSSVESFHSALSFRTTNSTAKEEEKDGELTHTGDKPHNNLSELEFRHTGSRP